MLPVNIIGLAAPGNPLKNMVGAVGLEGTSAKEISAENAQKSGSFEGRLNPAEPFICGSVVVGLWFILAAFGSGHVMAMSGSGPIPVIQSGG